MLAVGGAGLLDKTFTAFVWGVLWCASAGGAQSGATFRENLLRFAEADGSTAALRPG